MRTSRTLIVSTNGSTCTRGWASRPSRTRLVAGAMLGCPCRVGRRRGTHPRSGCVVGDRRHELRPVGLAVLRLFVMAVKLRTVPCGVRVVLRRLHVECPFLNKNVARNACRRAPPSAHAAMRSSSPPVVNRRSARRTCAHRPEHRGDPRRGVALVGQAQRLQPPPDSWGQSALAEPVAELGALLVGQPDPQRRPGHDGSFTPAGPARNAPQACYQLFRHPLQSFAVVGESRESSSPA